MRKPVLALVAASALGVAAVPAFAATKTVKLTGGDKFSPSSLTVKKNDKVKFVWKGGTHNVVAKGRKPFADIAIKRSGSVTRTAKKTGTFNLECTLHPGMDLRLRVK